MAYPTDILDLDDASSAEFLPDAHNGFGHAEAHNAIKNDLIAAETKLGTGTATPDANEVLVGNGTGTSTWLAGLTNAYIAAAAAIAVTKLAAQPAARVSRNSTQSITNATLTAIQFVTEVKDNDTMVDIATNATRITCKTAGEFSVSGYVPWGPNATGARFVAIYKNGGAVRIQRINAVIGGETSEMSIACNVDLAVNDYLELMVYQTSGGALNVSIGAAFDAVRVG